MPQRTPGLAFNFKLQHGGEADRAQHAQPIFREALRGIADRADRFPFQIVAAADEIDHFVFHRIEKHSVDREIASPRIFLGR